MSAGNPQALSGLTHGKCCTCATLSHWHTSHPLNAEATTDRSAHGLELSAALYTAVQLLNGGLYHAYRIVSNCLVALFV
jgi:hypothetical protein